MMSSTPYHQESCSAETEPPLTPVAPASSPSFSSTRRRKSPFALKQPLQLAGKQNYEGFMVPSLSNDGNGDDNGELMHTENEGMPSETTEPDEKRATVSGTLWHAIYGKSKALVFGQVLSLFLACTGAIQSSLYLDCHLSAPTFSMLSFYLPLCVVCLTQLIWKERNQLCTSQQTYGDGDIDQNDGDAESGSSSKHNRIGCIKCTSSSSPNIKQHSLLGVVPLQSSPLLYLAVAFTDVYANYVTILAFKYTTITSVSLFDALAIPSAMIVSRIFVGRRYTKVHLLGVMMCCIGIAINILQDYREDKRMEQTDGEDENAQEELIEKDYPYKMTGDILAILGGILFGITNTLGEVAVKNWGTRTEYLGCMSFFATIISLIQALAFERQEIAEFFGQGDSESCSERQGLTLMFAFSAASIVNYVGISAFLQVSEAAFLNLSLLTGDMWAVAFSVFAEGIIPPPSFYVALVVTVSGVFIYETSPSPVVEDSQCDASEAENAIEMFRNEIEMTDADTNEKDRVRVPVLA